MTNLDERDVTINKLDVLRMLQDVVVSLRRLWKAGCNKNGRFGHKMDRDGSPNESYRAYATFVCNT